MWLIYIYIYMYVYTYIIYIYVCVCDLQKRNIMFEIRKRRDYKATMSVNFPD